VAVTINFVAKAGIKKFISQVLNKKWQKKGDIF
jgi:hypothetical protein